IEFAANHLPGLRALVRLIFPEVKRSGELARSADELNAVFLDEVAALHLLKHLEPFEDPIRLGNQRFADVETWKAFALEKNDAMALLRDQGRDGAARWPAADYNYVGCLIHVRQTLHENLLSL